MMKSTATSQGLVLVSQKWTRNKTILWLILPEDVIFCAFLVKPSSPVQRDGDTAQLVGRRTGTPLTQVQFRCGKGFFSQSQLSVQIPLRCPYNTRVQSHALTSVRTLKIPRLAPIPLLELTKIPYALLGLGSAALKAAVALPSKGDPHFPQGINEV